MSSFSERQRHIVNHLPDVPDRGGGPPGYDANFMKDLLRRLSEAPDKQDFLKDQSFIVFDQRRLDTHTLLSSTHIANQLATRLPENPKVLDLLTGAGAGLQGAHDALSALGKKPKSMVGVDTFQQFHDPDDQLIMLQTGNALDFQTASVLVEMHSEGTQVELLQTDALSFLTSPDTPQFDLVTGFSIPIDSSSLRPNQFIDVLKAVEQSSHADTVALFTFGVRSRHLRQAINRAQAATNSQGGRLLSSSEEGKGWQWTFYEKPAGIARPNWDAIIATNLSLPYRVLNS